MAVSGGFRRHSKMASFLRPEFLAVHNFATRSRILLDVYEYRDDGDVAK